MNLPRCVSGQTLGPDAHVQPRFLTGWMAASLREAPGSEAPIHTECSLQTKLDLQSWGVS